LPDYSHWLDRNVLPNGAMVAGKAREKQPENAVERLKRRISERIDAEKDRPQGYRKTQQGLADAIGISKQTLSELLGGPQATRGLLAHLDKIAKYFGVPPSLLVHRNDTALMELQTIEYRLLQHWRSFPIDVQDRVIELFDYFAGLLPEEKEERRIWQRWRRLSAPAREKMEQILQDALKAEQTAKRAIRSSRAAADHTGENPGPAQTRRPDDLAR
jgi:transcriptional regulator with XRE-family HTH domain